MYTWINTANDLCLFSSCTSCPLPLDHSPSTGQPEQIFRFAVEAGDRESRVYMELVSTGENVGVPSVQLLSAPKDCRVEISPGMEAGWFRVCLIVPPSKTPDREDELVIELSGDVPPCLVVVRRSTCKINSALLDCTTGQALMPQTQAAILWHSWRRYREVTCLKRFTTGKSGSDVLVFRPKLREPCMPGSLPQGCCIEGVISESWGSCLLVKTGEIGKIREEWDRFQIFLTDRLHPFMARNDALLAVRPADETGGKQLATVIGSFLGGELLQAESLEQTAKTGAGFEHYDTIMNRLFAVLGTWHGGSVSKNLEYWSKIFQFDRDGGINLFGKYDLSTKSDRSKFAAQLAWDVAFEKEEHLSGHLLGKNKDGLLYRLMNMPVRYSLTHGDLHPRNILADSENVWLLDFGEIGVAPTLFDFAKLEVYLRLWCLEVTSTGHDFVTAANQFEIALLDNLMRTEGSLDSAGSLAPLLGASPEALVSLARCISSIRRHAARYSQGGPDYRDYLAVLFLTLLHTLRFAGESPELTANYKLLLSLFWLLEDILSKVHGMAPYSRARAPLTPSRLVSRNWLAAPDAPERVVYLMNRPEGQTALQPLYATCGVLQSQRHHCDVFDHSILVLAYIEELLRDPVGGFLDPFSLDRRVNESLRRQGIIMPKPSAAGDGNQPEIAVPGDVLDDIRELLRELLDGDTQLLLKWVALFHDVGKPATRTMSDGSKKGGERIQFLGHELYGQRLVSKHAEWLFPENGQRARFDHLIKKHHAPHNIVDRYMNSGPTVLEQPLLSCEMPPREFKFLSTFMALDTGQRSRDFPLLMLHGFADSLACRGPESKYSLALVAQIDLLLLGLYQRYPRIVYRRTMEEKFKELSSGLGVHLGITGPPLGRVLKGLKEWFLERTFPKKAKEAAEPIPAFEQILEQAKKLASELDALPAAPKEKNEAKH